MFHLLNVSPPFFIQRMEEKLFTYPEELKTPNQKKKFRSKKIRECPETLFSDEPCADGIYQLLFYTKNTLAWHRALGDEEPRNLHVSYSTHSNGTVRINRYARQKKASQDKFIEIFDSIKDKAHKYVKEALILRELGGLEALVKDMGGMGLGDEQGASGRKLNIIFTL